MFWERNQALACQNVLKVLLWNGPKLKKPIFNACDQIVLKPLYWDKET